MKLFNLLFFIITISIINTLYTVDSVITFFITEEPILRDSNKNNNSKTVSKPLLQPSYIKAIAPDNLWNEQPGVDGIQASYLGYIATSDKNGQITFPRLQQSDTIYLLITPAINPSFMIDPFLIAYWITHHDLPAACYEINRKKNKDLNTYFFEVKKINVPEKIEFNTIIIYAHPEHIYVPTGISLNTYSVNFILPELRARKFDTSKNSLYTLSIKQYFEQINKESKNNAPSIVSMIVN